MKVFDPKEVEPEEKAEVFYNVAEFNTRPIQLPAGGQMPTCDMDSYVLFYIVDGVVKVTVDGEEEVLDDGDCLVTEPTTLSMKAEDGARVLGFIRIHILYHATKEPFYGSWMIEELENHGYELSPGTLYPILSDLEESGYLKSYEEAEHSRRQNYRKHDILLDR